MLVAKSQKIAASSLKKDMPASLATDIMHQAAVKAPFASHLY
jgi:hypothetical protein